MMPPKSKKKQLYEQRAKVAREGKKQLSTSEPSQTEATMPPEQSVPPMPPTVPPTSDPLEQTDESDYSYDPDADVCVAAVALETFVENWILSLDRDDTISLGLFLLHHLTDTLKIPKTKAAEFCGMMMSKADRTIRQWNADFFNHGGSIPDNKQGKYQRSGVLWSSEDLNRKASRYVRENANVKGKPNLTTASFCRWINEDLLPNASLPPGFPRRVSVETARRWMHEMGFETLSVTKGMFFDGHERPDVVEQRKVFLEEMVTVGFLHPDHAPTPEAARCFPSQVPLASLETREKAVVFFHDESIYHVNEGQQTVWGKEGEHVLRPKSKGAGIMVSDFISEKCGYLALTSEELIRARRTNPSMKQAARLFLEYGESKEGYFTSNKFMEQMKTAVAIAEVKYPKEEGWKQVWVFDQSSCHKAMAEDALDVNAMNVKPGGKQAIMRDTVWAGIPQRMVLDSGVAKGMKQVLEERGINTATLVGDQMKIILQNHDDFRNEKPKLIHYLNSMGHVALYLPKFHPEINPIERVWAQSKCYTKAYCKYTLVALRETIPQGLDSVTLDQIKNFHRKCRNYMFAYFEGHVAGMELEKQIKKYKKVIKSHRRISMNE